MAEILERGKWKAKWIIEKYANRQDYESKRPYEVLEIDGNILLNEGINALLQLITGTGSPAPWNSANARIGVGDGTTAESASQTGLQGTNKAFQTMDSGYPTVSGTTATWKATFTETMANFTWNEVTIVNGADDNGINLNRKVSSMGTKASGSVWSVTLSITIS